MVPLILRRNIVATEVCQLSNIDKSIWLIFIKSLSSTSLMLLTMKILAALCDSRIQLADVMIPFDLSGTSRPNKSSSEYLISPYAVLLFGLFKLL